MDTETPANGEAPQHWGVVANVAKERGYGPESGETRNGTKHFRGGAKVHIIDCYAGMRRNVAVVGLHRQSRKLVTCVVRVEPVENLRLKLVYSPSVNEAIARYVREDGHPLTRDLAEEMLGSLPAWQEEERVRRLRTPHHPWWRFWARWTRTGPAS